MRGFDGAGRASCAYRTGQTLQIERDDESFAFDAGELDVGGVGSARGAGAVHSDLRDAFEQAAFELIPERCDACGIRD